METRGGAEGGFLWGATSWEFKKDPDGEDIWAVIGWFGEIWIGGGLIERSGRAYNN